MQDLLVPRHGAGTGRGAGVRAEADLEQKKRERLKEKPMKLKVGCEEGEEIHRRPFERNGKEKRKEASHTVDCSPRSKCQLN